MTEIAANPEQTRDILSLQNIIKKLRGGGRKRKKASSHSHKAKRVKIAKYKSSKRKAPPKTIKRHSRDAHQSLPVVYTPLGPAFGQFPRAQKRMGVQFCTSQKIGPTRVSCPFLNF